MISQLIGCLAFSVEIGETTDGAATVHLRQTVNVLFVLACLCEVLKAIEIPGQKCIRSMKYAWNVYLKFKFALEMLLMNSQGYSDTFIYFIEYSFYIIVYVVHGCLGPYTGQCGSLGFR